ncbi:hypothetical protein K504DRAFT_462253 [Pleomassaria siparia CBS 279.74]|uniref:Uncharacterized protein n=1 Tax=Pleomassaria siparia CBS 279.74 TaxID=1314801 RepID=A0A6G1KLN9_9PLEO|nr:hypothetical protein K504DRAFT_462253 [Pleomassaria siparia CBS 279.74]
MVDKGKQPATSCRPSRLRNEINPDSTDNDQRLEQSHIQVPDCDIVVPETQLEPEFDSGEDETVSPQTKAVLAKLKITRPHKAPETVPFRINFLSRPNFHGDRPKSPEFSPWQAPSTAPRPTTKSDVTVSQREPHKVPESVPEFTVLTPVLEPAIDDTGKDEDNGLPRPSANLLPVKKRNKRNGWQSKRLTKLPVSQHEPGFAPEHEPELNSFAEAVGEKPAAADGILEPPCVLDESQVDDHHRMLGPAFASHEVGGDDSLGISPIQSDFVSTKDEKRFRPSVRKSKKGNKIRKALPGTRRNAESWPLRLPHGERRSDLSHQMSEDQPAILDVMPHDLIDHEPPANGADHANMAAEEQALEAVGCYHDHVSQGPDEHIHSSDMVRVGRMDTRSQQVFTAVEEHPRSPDAGREGVAVNGCEPISPIVNEYPEPLDLGVDATAATQPTTKRRHTVIGHVLAAKQRQTHDANSLGMEVSQHGAPESHTLDNPEGMPISYADDRAMDGILRPVAGPSRVLRGRNKRPRLTAGYPYASTIKPGKFSQDIQISPAVVNALNTVRLAVESDMSKATAAYSYQLEERDNRVVSLKGELFSKDDTIKQLEDAGTVMRLKLNTQTDRARQLSTWVDGLEHDHEKNRETTKTYHDAVNKAWNEKVAEMEGEKAELRRQTQDTIVALEKSHRSVNRVMVECHEKLLLSEQKKNALVHALLTQDALLESEKRKSAYLEEQIKSTLHNIQEQLEKSNNTVFEKLSSIQTSVSDTTADEARDSCLNKCVDVLNSLRATPFLTVKDTQKAEAMLRFVHESFDLKLGSLSESVKEKSFPSDDLQNFIQIQLAKMKADILQYDEVSAECQKVRQTNHHLNKQLEAQKEHHEKLNARVGSLIQSETDLKSRSSGLEAELNALKDVVRSRDLVPSNQQQEVIALHGQLKQAQDDLHATMEKLNGSEKLAQDCQIKYTDFVKKGHKFKERYTQDTEKKFEEKRRDMEVDCRKRIEEIHAKLGNDVHRLTRERDDKHKALQTTVRELEATRDVLQRAQQEIRNAEAETNTIRKEKTNIETKLETAHCVMQQSSSNTSELVNIRTQLQQTQDLLQVKEQELDHLQQEHDTLQCKSSVLQESINEFQIQVSGCQSIIETMRREADILIAEKRKNDRAALQEALNQNDTLKEEKQDIESSIERHRSKEVALKDAQVRLLREAEELREEVAELQAAKKVEVEKSQRVRKEADEELQRIETKSRSEIDELQRRLKQAQEALQEADVKFKQSHQSWHDKLEIHERVSNQKINELIERRKDEIRERVQEEQTPPQNLATTIRNPASTSKSPHTGKTRKTVNRRNSYNMVATTSQASRPYESPPRANCAGEPSDNFQRVDAFYSGDLGTRESLGEEGVSMFDSDCELVPETQLEGPRMSVQRFEEDVASSAGPKGSLMVEFSLDVSDEILHDEAEKELPRQRKRHEAPSCASNRVHADRPSAETRNQTPSEPSRNLGLDPYSYDRSKSQANTASRMVAPRDRTNQDGMLDSNAIGFRQSSHRGSHASSPDLLHQNGPRVIHGPHHTGKPEPLYADRKENLSRVTTPGAHSKRKSTVSHDERSTPLTKKGKKTGQNNVSSIPHHSPHVPDVANQLQKPTRTPSQTVATGSGAYTSRRTRTGTQYGPPFV